MKRMMCLLLMIVFVGYYANSEEPAKSSDPRESVIEAGSFTNLFGSDLIDAKLDKVSVDSLNGKKIGIYFSAHWCPPCRSFTPLLVDVYEKLKKDGKQFEIIFVSSDRSQKDMEDYMKSAAMPWLALSFDSKMKSELGVKYGLRGIPTLVIIGADGKLLSKDGRRDVMELGVKAFDKW